MMKNKYLFLFAIAALFSTNSLFAMDEPEEEEHTSGVFGPLSKDESLKILEEAELSLQDLRSVAIISKSMYTLWQRTELSPYVIVHLPQYQHDKLIPCSWTAQELVLSHLKPFANPDINYLLPVTQIR